jgi:NAD(P)-dependent dehydrogenase (short-subunit alcohol dehydrogenase family)
VKPDDLFSLHGVTAFVTGASGGLGEHFALTLAAAGAKVALAARGLAPLDRLARKINDIGGCAVAIQVDVTNAAMVAQGFAAAQQALGAITLLVNNSGTTATGPMVDLDEASWHRIMDTNLKGAWLCSSCFARRLIELKKPGVIINTASILGLRVAGQVGAYAASKAALIQMTRSLALELARYQIRVNALAPGYIATALNRQFLATQDGQNLVKRIPQRRLGELKDLEGPLLLLASEASRFMTGAVVAVDGGHLVNTL